MKYSVKYTRKNSWPVAEIKAGDEVEEIIVEEKETFIKNNIRYYRLTSGHGTWHDLVAMPIVIDSESMLP